MESNLNDINKCNSRIDKTTEKHFEKPCFQQDNNIVLKCRWTCSMEWLCCIIILPECRLYLAPSLTAATYMACFIYMVGALHIW